MGAAYDNLGAYLPDQAYDDYDFLAFHEGDNAWEGSGFWEVNQQQNQEPAKHSIPLAPCAMEQLRIHR